MRDASRLQQRSVYGRWLAVVVATWLVVSSVLAGRHEAHVAHVVDAAGAIHHAEQLTGHHVADSQADIHGVTAEGDSELCDLLAALHQPAQVAIGRPLVLHSLAVVEVPVIPRAPVVAPALHVFRLAPKTSPPRG